MAARRTLSAEVNLTQRRRCANPSVVQALALPPQCATALKLSLHTSLLPGAYGKLRGSARNNDKLSSTTEQHADAAVIGGGVSLDMDATIVVRASIYSLNRGIDRSDRRRC
jgi:hypothetical protein